MTDDKPVSDIKTPQELTPWGNYKTVELPSALLEIGERLRIQDNRCTANPMFCVQILCVEPRPDGMGSGRAWYSPDMEREVYDEEPPSTDEDGEPIEWEEYAYAERWETVMVSLTEGGCERYLELNGHNDRRRAHKGQVRIYAESFNRCPEMIAIREFLMGLPAPAKAPDDERPTSDTAGV